MLFTSDNWGGVHPEIMAAIAAADGGFAPAYGNDELTDRVRKLFAEIFEKEAALAFVPTGSAANGIALSLLTQPFGATICHEHAHILIDECGAPEFYTGGAKVIPAAGAFGKLTPESVREAMAPYDPPMAHRVKPSVLSLTQATEWGTVYTSVEIRALRDVADQYGMKMHMDGARFAGAVNASGATPAELTWKAGVDILSLGATKNGCLQAEAVVVFDTGLAEELTYRCKRAGLGTSKQRFFSAQWPAYFGGGLWLSLAEEARAKCAEVADIFAATDDCEVLVEPQINELFVRMPHDRAKSLRDAGAEFYDWVQPGDPYAGEARRFVTSWETTGEQVEALKRAL
ncbi:threonine aldolase family protein [Parvularcula lutaonensis]|uniref:Threonine aldolase family protein n=1 Tax=Parvularcula lutaonensis TaxID=491923 RepID=A0ABV7MAM6_9PROT|nr:low specificity L-threonine aldolase [Parvularcula lutaonensis]GGY46418.1 L-threonine aldolase [Parvularcula lutaonensis]